MSDTDMHEIDFEPIGKRIKIKKDQSLLAAAQAAGIQIAALCGGYGTCGACKVRIMSGAVSDVTSVEIRRLSAADIESGLRFACQTYPRSDVKVNIPPESLSTFQRLQLEGIEETFDISESVIKTTPLRMSPPTIHDLRSDSLRMREELERNGISISKINFHYFSSMSDWLRTHEWEFKAITRKDELISVIPLSSSALGLAVDIGSTKVAAYLIDLEKNKTLAKKGIMNPQISYGEDVVSRIAYANDNPNGRNELQGKLIESLNQLIDELCEETGQQSYQIVEAVVVCNTAIHHFFLNFPVRQLGIYPFIPVIDEAISIPAISLGLKTSRGAYVYIPNNIAGYVGADHVSMLIASKVNLKEKTVLALDIGTNTEISLSHQGNIYSCSCASGPAFEGAHIKYGMRAAAGAIERAQYIDGHLKYQTINNKKPVGICGSGILDLIGTLREAEIINERGNFNKEDPNVRPAARNYEYVVVPQNESGIQEAITLTRSDINEIILAKSAIRTGIDVLLIEAKIQAEDIEEFIVAGAFGTYLSLENAIRIGMFPAIQLERYEQVGNAAGIGAKNLLMSEKLRTECEYLHSRTRYVELTSHPDFKNILVRNMSL